MSLLLLAGLFIVTCLLLLRLPDRPVALSIGFFALLVALGVTALGSPSRAQAVLVFAGLLLGGGIVASGGALPRIVLRRSRGSKARTRNATGGPPTAEVVLREYETLARVGIGGMGSVYRARRLIDGRIVALKVPQEKYLADPKFAKRFYREAEVLRRLAHPNIVKVFDYKAEPGEHYIAMEYLDGETLERMLESNPPSFEQSVQIVRALAEALKHIHSQNIVHRDLKPANVMVLRGAFHEGKLREGGVKLMDFGIAVGKVLTRLTMTGARVGTPAYMSPEQSKGHKVDERSDVYSLGMLLYELLTGEPPFKGSFEAVVHQQVFEAPRPPRQVRVEIPGRLNDLTLRMIEKDPDARPDLDEVIASIDRGVLEEDRFEDAEALALSVTDRQGALRLLDLQGRLRVSLRDLSGERALPSTPCALTVDERGTLYAAVVSYRSSTGAGQMLHKLGSDGRELLSFGRPGLAESELLQPASLCYARDRLYVLDRESCFVSMFSPAGEYLGRFGGRGSGQGTFDAPQVIVAGAGGDLFILDSGNRQVQRLTGDGRYVSRLAFRQDREGHALRPLDGLAVDEEGRVYIGDAKASRIRCIGLDGQASTVFNVEGLENEPMDAPWLMTFDEDGHLYCVRRGGQVLRKFSREGRLLATFETYAPVQALTLLKREGVRVPA